MGNCSGYNSSERKKNRRRNRLFSSRANRRKSFRVSKGRTDESVSGKLFVFCSQCKGQAGRRPYWKQGELTITLPDTYIDRTKSLLLGRQHGESLTISAEADELEFYKGSYFTVIDLLKPNQQEMTIRMESEKEMSLKVYLFSEHS